MKISIQIAMTAILSYLTELFLPTWCIFICAAAVATICHTSSVSAFISGFVAVGLLWTLMATVIDAKTNAILSTKMAPLFGLQSATTLILLTGLVGGIMGGLGALSGQQIRTLLAHKEPKRPLRRY